MTSRNVQRRPNGIWRARYRDEAGKERARHFKRKIDAQQWLDEITASVVRGDYVDPEAGKVTFRAFFTDWMNAQDWTAGTRETAELTLASVTFADVPMRLVTETHVRAWLKSMREPGEHRKAGLAASTRRTRFNYVRMAFIAAVRLRVIRHDPSAGIDAPKVPKAETKMKVPTPEQVGQALRAADVDFRAYVAVCAFAGLRLGEAAALQVGDVDFLRRTLTVERQVQGQTSSSTAVVAPKYGSSRVVPIPEQLVTILAEHVQRVGVYGDEGWLFASGSARLNRNSAGNRWRRLRSQVGMEGFTLHDLRHFYASGLIAAGCDVVTVQHALGHSSPSITLGVYSHLWPKADERTRAAAAALAESALADSVRTAAAE